MAEKWMELAWSQVGVHETAGKAATPEIVTFFREAGHPEVVSDETAWCAAFVGAMLERAGIHGTRSLLARSYLTFGTEIDEPREGAIAVFSRGADPASGHVGFVVGATKDTIALLSGNQKDSVCVMHMPRSQLLPGGLRWPAPPVTAAELAADGSRIAGAAQIQKRDALVAGSLEAGGQVVEKGGDLVGLGSLATKAGESLASMQTFEAFIAFAWAKAGWIGAAVALFFLARMAWNAGLIGSWRAEDHSTGKTGA